MNIIIGQTEKSQLKLDVDVLLRTRMLIQANSGGGKSFLLRRLAEQLFGKPQVQLDEARLQKEMETYERTAKEHITAYRVILTRILKSLQATIPGKISELQALMEYKIPEEPVWGLIRRPVTPSATKPVLRETKVRIPETTRQEPATDQSLDDIKLGACERAILSFTGTNPDRSWSKSQVGIMTGYSPRSSGFDNALSSLNTKGFIVRQNGMIQYANGPIPENECGEFSIENIKRVLGKCELEILEVLLRDSTADFSKEDLAGQTPSHYSPKSSGFDNSLSKLSTLGLISRRGGRIALSDDAKELI